MRPEVSDITVNKHNLTCRITGSFLPRHALLVTVLCEARGTMKPLVERPEERAVRQTQFWQHQAGWELRMMACVTHVNAVNADRPKMLTGLDQNGKGYGWDVLISFHVIHDSGCVPPFTSAKIKPILKHP